MTRVGRTGFLTGLSATLLASVLEAAALFRFYRTQLRLPLWDMAGNGWGGVELLQAFAAGQPLHFLSLLNHQDKWPFGYSLLLLPFLAAGGSSFASATLLSTLLFALTPALMLWLAWEADPGPPGLWSGLLAAALFLASPLPRVFAIVVMREMAGIALSLAAVGLYLRARRLNTVWSWRLAGLSLLALFLVKYNYCLIVGLALLAGAIWRRWPLRLSWPGWTPGRILLAVYLGLLLLVALLGVNPGVGIYAGLVVGAGVLAVRWGRDREGFSTRWRTLPVEVRSILATVVAPLWLWGLSPSPIHPRSLLAFLHNRTEGPPILSVESLLFYPRSLLEDYSARPILGLLAIALALVSLPMLRRSEGWRPVAFTAFLGLALATLHPYKEARFLATSVPFLMLVAALAFARLAHAVTRQRRLAGGLLCTAALAAIAWTAAGCHLAERLETDYPLYSAPETLWKPLQFLSDQTQAVPRVAVIGTFNELSDSLVRWRLAQQDAKGEAVVVSPPRRADAELGQLRRWLAEERPVRILALQLRPNSPFYNDDYQRYNAWQLAMIDTLEKIEGWQEKEVRVFEPLALEVVVLEPTSPSGSMPRGDYVDLVRFNLSRKGQGAPTVAVPQSGFCCSAPSVLRSPCRPKCDPRFPRYRKQSENVLPTGLREDGIDQLRYQSQGQGR
ncbi:MAG TPA: hypothetical protein VLV54_05425 [Thermoanaerobaculia bacterium]|nr:hypothetical protein [Thermoanaerobaculia bacterium]